MGAGKTKRTASTAKRQDGASKREAPETEAQLALPDAHPEEGTEECNRNGAHRDTHPRLGVPEAERQAQGGMDKDIVETRPLLVRTRQFGGDTFRARFPYFGEIYREASITKMSSFLVNTDRFDDLPFCHVSFFGQDDSIVRNKRMTVRTKMDTTGTSRSQMEMFRQMNF